VQNITLSKAFGVYGGAILCSSQLREKLASSRMFIGSTPLPLPLVFASIQSEKLVRQEHGLRRRLQANSAFVKSALRKAGFTLADSPGPIVPLYFEDARTSAQLKRALLTAGVLPPFINYHGGPADGYFRFVISSEHTRQQLRTLVQTLLPFAPTRN